MFEIYGGVLDEPGSFPHAPRKRPPIKEPKDPDGIWWCDGRHQWHTGDKLGDTAFLRLTRYDGSAKSKDPKGPVMLATGFGMSSHSFLAPTIETNLTEFLFDAGYDVWLFDYRAGIDLKSSGREFTIDDIAQVDWRIGVKKALEETGRDELQVFGHCVGSVSLQMAVLDGLQGVRSAVCAQFSVHPQTSLFNWAKSELRVGKMLDLLGVKVVAPDNVPSPPDAVLDLTLRALPIPRGERCGQAVCRWINAIYGCTHRHAQLNEDTHQALNQMFGVGNIESLQHLTLMMRRRLAVDHTGSTRYLAHPQRLSIPLMLLQGTHNYIFHPSGTLRTLRWLRHHNAGTEYRREVLRDYGHLDAIVGSNAARDVYPRIASFLDRT
jgi:cholesterol oxidase